MPVVIDPELRILPHDHKIFVLHPGEGKRFYGDFIEMGVVFLDIPGISFDTPPDIDDANLRNRLRMARRIGLWRRRGSPEDDAPSRNPDDYTVSHPLAEAPRFAREVHELYSTAKAGDLIIIPGKGYNTTVFLVNLRRISSLIIRFAVADIHMTTSRPVQLSGIPSI